ncbi:sensor histidine kinase [Limnobacter sp.]|uniref:sensor histidine kinase n=1 Tax=Limnobacter sp. TaxID=2003368 RepID=UPI0035110870
MRDEALRYSELLQRFVLGVGQQSTEADLAEAFELGRTLVEKQVPPDELMGIHHEAVVSLAQSSSNLPFAEVAERITAPLLELSMAYGLAFRKQTEDHVNQLMRARYERTSRLQAVATLASGIAHDFNNIVGSIQGHAELIEDHLPECPSLARHTQPILKGCQRAGALVEQMLTFARQQPVQALPVNLAEQVHECARLIRSSMPAQIRLQVEEHIEPPWVQGDPGALGQLIMNLALNAKDAIEGAGRVRLVLQAVEGQPPLEHIDSPQHQVLLLVQDTGSGMPQNVISQIFNPFFTTKPPGSGSGLGLSVVHGIVSHLGGLIEVRSSPGQGTTFFIQLPTLRPVVPLLEKRSSEYEQYSAN